MVVYQIDHLQRGRANLVVVLVALGVDKYASAGGEDPNTATQRIANSLGGNRVMAANQSGHDIIVATAVELIGVALFGILAGINDDLGKVLVIVMWGFVLGWLLLNSAQLKAQVSKL